ncbi:MAG: hypothetical protein ACRDUA_11965, partial [Micromonosporaceae bacterium]
TFVSAGAPSALAVALLLVGQRFEVAALAGLGFGVGRAATPLLRYVSAAGEHWDVRMLHRIRTVTVLSSTALAAGLGVLLLW